MEAPVVAAENILQTNVDECWRFVSSWPDKIPSPFRLRRPDCRRNGIFLLFGTVDKILQKISF